MQINRKCRLSENFTLEELFHSNSARLFKIKNIPATRIELARVYINARALARNVLQPIRNAYGLMNVTSWYRSPELNRKLGGVDTSQHCKAEASDFVYSQVTLDEIFDKIVSGELDVPFDQVIYEQRGNDWLIHISHKRFGENRREALTSLSPGSYKPYSVDGVHFAV